MANHMTFKIYLQRKYFALISQFRPMDDHMIFKIHFEQKYFAVISQFRFMVDDITWIRGIEHNIQFAHYSCNVLAHNLLHL